MVVAKQGTVWAHNITRQLDEWFPKLVTPSNLVIAARLSSVPFTVTAALVAISSQQTGYLLIVALYVFKRSLCLG
jgi:hypothetical protein